MNPVFLRKDVEGDLVRFVDPAGEHLGKRLSTDVAWHVFDPQDLRNVPNSAVASVETDVGAGCHWIHYEGGLEPLDANRLTELLDIDRPLASWRVARFARNVAEQLQALHAEGIPQMVIHPERVGCLHGRFVLLPTFAGMLPTIGQLPSNQIGSWLEFVAPEVLRTRGMDEALLPAGDVYSLGALCRILCQPSWEFVDQQDVQELADYRVEGTSSDLSARGIPEWDELTTLFTRLTALDPAQRLGLKELLDGLDTFLGKHSPQQQFRQLVQTWQLDTAAKLLMDCDATLKTGAFTIAEHAVHVMKAYLALEDQPADYRQALTYLLAADTGDDIDPEVHRLMGRAYGMWTDLADHVERSRKAYETAATWSRWQPDIVDEWLTTLQGIDDPEQILDITEEIPDDRRTRKARLLRCDCFVKLNAPVAAWHELADIFPRSVFDAGLYEQAKQLAAGVDEDELTAWLVETGMGANVAGYAAPMSIAVARVGDAAVAQKLLQAAQTYKP